MSAATTGCAEITIYAIYFGKLPWQDWMIYHTATGAYIGRNLPLIYDSDRFTAGAATRASAGGEPLVELGDRVRGACQDLGSDLLPIGTRNVLMLLVALGLRSTDAVAHHENTEIPEDRLTPPALGYS